MAGKIRIGTRKSRLAVVQAELVIGMMRRYSPEAEFEIVYKVTEGDRILDKPLLEFGGKGVFVSEFEQALQNGEIDFAVHSAKDMPMKLAEGLRIAGVPKREDPRDVLVTLKNIDWDRCRGKKEIVIGTSSQRRKLQIEGQSKVIWPGSVVQCENLRGNVTTRLDKLKEGQYDGIILAAAGLKRLKLNEDENFKFHYFDCREFIPAGGQGILAVEGRADSPLLSVAEAVTDRDTEVCLNVERRVLELLNAGCHEPVGVYACIEGETIYGMGISRRSGKTRSVFSEMKQERAADLASFIAGELM